MVNETAADKKAKEVTEKSRKEVEAATKAAATAKGMVQFKFNDSEDSVPMHQSTAKALVAHKKGEIVK